METNTQSETTTSEEGTPRNTREQNAELLAHMFAAAIPPEMMTLLEGTSSPCDVATEIALSVMESPRATMQAKMGAMALMLMASEENFTWEEIHAGVASLSIRLIEKLINQG